MAELAEKLQDCPQNTAAGLGEFVRSAQSVFGDDLKSIVLYGSGAEGRLRAASDVNVLVVLREFRSAQADAIRGPFTVAQAAIRLSAMFLLESEVETAMLAFGQKFSDILRRHRVLYGADPFEGRQISPSAVLARVKQVLLNLTLRLREAYVERGSAPERLSGLIADVSGPLRSCAATLLELEGKPPLSPKEALIEFVRGFDGQGWTETLAAISETRERQLLPADAADQALFRMIELAERLRARAGAVHV